MTNIYFTSLYTVSHYSLYLQGFFEVKSRRPSSFFGYSCAGTFLLQKAIDFSSCLLKRQEDLNALNLKHISLNSSIMSAFSEETNRRRAFMKIFLMLLSNLPNIRSFFRFWFLAY